MELNRHELAIPDERIAYEFGRLLDTFSDAQRKAASADAMCQRVNKLSRQGMTWVEALEAISKGKDLKP